MADTNPWRPAGAERTNWRDHAACRGLDPDLFFPVSSSGASLTDIEAAKRVCQRCPVRTPCLHWALDLGQVSGIWGGTTEEERRALRRAPVPRAPAEPVPTGLRPRLKRAGRSRKAEGRERSW
jgi:WhiB family transcriptional regulator, redox-sensing transcriptional regulator